MEDRLFWGLEKRGFYSVKTAYWIARASVLGNAFASTSNGDPFQGLWKKLWKAHVPGKVKICLWRACNDLLPTRIKLTTKGFQGETTCPLCPHRFEDITHILCHCPTASSILAAPPFNLGGSLLPQGHFKDWMLDHASQFQQELFDHLLMVLWVLWRNKNNMVWNGTSQSAHDIFLSATAWFDEFRHAQQVSKPVGNKSRQRWQPDPDGRWKLNVDGSYLPNQVTGGLGGVLRDDLGRFKAAFANPVNNVSTAKHTELMAIKDGLQLLESMQVDNVVLETDCLEAIYDISNATHTVTVLGGLIDDIKAILLAFRSVIISHTPRTCNGVAHRLACIAFEARESCFWYTRPPNCIATVLQYDCNHSG